MARRLPAAIPEDALQVARVGRPHGVRGELRLLPESDRPARLERLTRIWLKDADDEVAAFDVTAVRSHGEAALVTVAGIADRDAAAKWTNAEAWASRDELPAWEPDEFALSEIEGWSLFDEGSRIGPIVGVTTNAGRDYLEVERGGGTVMVPAVKDWLVEKDAAGRRIVMRLPAGLVE